MTYIQTGCPLHLLVGCHEVRQFGDLMIIVRTVETDIEFDVTGIYRMRFQLELNTLVDHRTTIDRTCAEAHRRSHRLIEEQVVDMFPEVVELEIQILAQTKLQTEVNLLAALPSQVLITLLLPNVSNLTIHILNRIEIICVLCRNTLVT